jgi:hypothetical protein
MLLNSVKYLFLAIWLKQNQRFMTKRIWQRTVCVANIWLHVICLELLSRNTTVYSIFVFHIFQIVLKNVIEIPKRERRGSKVFVTVFTIKNQHFKWVHFPRFLFSGNCGTREDSENKIIENKFIANITTNAISVCCYPLKSWTLYSLCSTQCKYHVIFTWLY